MSVPDAHWERPDIVTTHTCSFFFFFGILFSRSTYTYFTPPFVDVSESTVSFLQDGCVTHVSPTNDRRHMNGWDVRQSTKFVEHRNIITLNSTDGTLTFIKVRG